MFCYKLKKIPQIYYRFFISLQKKTLTLINSIFLSYRNKKIQNNVHKLSLSFSFCIRFQKQCNL